MLWHDDKTSDEAFSEERDELLSELSNSEITAEHASVLLAFILFIIRYCQQKK